MAENVDPSSLGLKAYWRMDQQQGLQSIRDATVNGNDAVLGTSALTGSDDPTTIVTDGPMSLICQRSTELSLKAMKVQKALQYY